MTSGKRKTKVETGLHVVRKLRDGKSALFYVYAYRGGPQIHSCEGERPTITPEILDAAADARRHRTATASDNLDRIITAYLASPEYKGLGDRTKADYRIELKKIGPRFGKVPYPVWNDQRMRADVMSWRSEMADKPRTADKAVVMLATLLGWAVTEGLIERNVAAGIPMLYKSNRAAIIWTEADWQAIEPHCSKELWQGLRFAALTGVRLGDLVKVSVEHVGPSAIVFITSKRDRRVVVPIFDELRALLKEIGREAGTILQNSRGKPWTESGFGGVFQKAKNKARGFDISLRIHDLRGTYATWLARRGLTDQEIGRIVAWSEQQVAEIRRRYVDEEHVVASLVERLNARTP